MERENYKPFIDEQERIFRECMPAGFYLIENVPKDMLPLLSERFNDYKTKIINHQSGLSTFRIRITWRDTERQKKEN